VHDEARPRRPDIGGNRRGEHWRDDQIWVVAADRLPHHLIPQRQLNRHRMAAAGKLDVCPLGQAVVGTRQQQDPHLAPPSPRSACVPHRHAYVIGMRADR